MVCPRCAAESKVKVSRVDRSKRADGRVSTRFDTRQIRCLTCGCVWREESYIALISVYNPETMKEKLVTVEEYAATWRHRDDIHPEKILLLFK